MKPFLRSKYASPVISALIWIIISTATGGSALFIIVGAVILLVLVYLIQEVFRRIGVGNRQ